MKINFYYYNYIYLYIENKNDEFIIIKKNTKNKVK
jgi:hypothetical protein